LLKDQVLQWVQQFAGLADKENWNVIEEKGISLTKKRSL